MASDSGVIVASVFNLGYREMATNFMYGATRFGGIKEILMFTFEDESLWHCLSLGFACYNGKLLFPEDPGHSAESSYGDPKWFKVRGGGSLGSGCP